MNEVTRLRTKHLDYGELENEDEHYDGSEGNDDDSLDHWYRNVTGLPDAVLDPLIMTKEFDVLRHPSEDLRLPLMALLDQRTSFLRPGRQLRPPQLRLLSTRRTIRLMRN